MEKSKRWSTEVNQGYAVFCLLPSAPPLRSTDVPARSDGEASEKGEAEGPTAEPSPADPSSRDRTAQCVQEYQKQEVSSSRYQSLKDDCARIDAALRGGSGGGTTDSKADEAASSQT